MKEKKGKKEKVIPDYTLDQAIQEFIAHLPDSEKEQNSKDLNSFVRWYGRGRIRKFKDTKVTELDDYSDFISRTSLRAAESLKPVKAFLTYAHKEGWTPSNLSVHLRARKIKQAGGTSSRKAADEVFLTEEGRQKLMAELEQLKEMRPRLAEDIRTAAADKDVRENAPLEAARERQGKVESRIKELEQLLITARVAQKQESSASKIEIGSRITICQVGTKELLCYQLVEPTEANLTDGKISVSSPIGKAIRGRWSGQVVSVTTPMGVLQYSIEEVTWGEENTGNSKQ